MTLSATLVQVTASSELSQIRQNIEMQAFEAKVGGTFAATVLQTDQASDGLLRDWPQITAGVEKNLAYAFQWFCLAALQLILYIWFQIIQPYRHARRTSL
jgi:surfeit locus 1 family protein